VIRDESISGHSCGGFVNECRRVCASSAALERRHRYGICHGGQRNCRGTALAFLNGDITGILHPRAVERIDRDR
jgi:hypothetical protein